MNDKQKDVPQVKRVTQSAKRTLKINLKITSSKFLKKCPTIKEFINDDIKEFEELAKNTHYEKNGEIYRLRVFIEDADNGSYRKLVHYKEDEDGFPRILKLPADKQVEPTQKYINSFYIGAEIIHEEQDYRLELNDGRQFTISEINGVVTKINSDKENCSFEE